MNPVDSNGSDPRGVPPAGPAAASPSLSPKLPDGLWVVIPAFNEAPRIGDVLVDLLRAAPNIVVVDDASTDETAQRVRLYPVWLLQHPVNLGQGAALQTGLDFALASGARYLVTFDADGQHQAGDLPALLQPLMEGRAHYSLGSRFLGQAVGIPRTRRWLIGAARLFTRLFSGIGLSDAHNGLRAMTRDGATRIRLTCNRMEHASEILDQIAHSGLPLVEVPVTVRYSHDTLAKGQRSSAAFSIAARLILERISQ